MTSRHITAPKQWLYGLVPVLAMLPLAGHTAPGSLSDTPLFVSNAVKHNIMLSMDDSGSMSSEVLFPTNDGALWWSTGSASFAADGGQLNFGPGLEKYVFLFPYTEGPSTNQHFKIPPLRQYGFARSAAYNAAYYDPTVRYVPWPDEGGHTFSDASPSNAPSDPVKSNPETFDLTARFESTDGDWDFRMYDGMMLPAGTRYQDDDDASWTTASQDVAVATLTGDESNHTNVAIDHFPAVYYRPVPTGSYTIQNNSGSTVLGDCDEPDPAHYDLLHDNPGAFTDESAAGKIDTLAPDGRCLTRVAIESGKAPFTGGNARTDCADPRACTYAEEIQNFANWFTYYRKRHLAVRNAAGASFQDMNNVRVGEFRINNRDDVTMWEFDEDPAEDESASFFDEIYDPIGGGGTPNRAALNHAGEQFMRTDSGAPIVEACQRNFTIFFTDGFATLSGPDVGNQDQGEGEPFGDEVSNTLADIAMKYYKENLNTGFTAGQVTTPTACDDPNPDPTLDCNPNLHMNTYSIGLGAKGSLFGVSHDTVRDAHDNPPEWPNVNAARDPRQVDDLYHAAVNGRGKMLSADTPAAVADAMRSVLTDITSKTGSAAAVTFNSATLSTNSSVYLALFNSNNWSGDLLSFPLDPDTGEVIDNMDWSGANVLDSQSATSRVVLTREDVDADSDGALEGLPFRWDELTADQRANLRTNFDGNSPVSEDEGRARLKYLRGDRSNEGNNRDFRRRNSRLGDIVHSSPVFVEEPALNWPAQEPFPTADGNQYAQYKPNRDGVIYVGANDGMLHGFDEDSGQEVLAYVPSNLFSGDSAEGLDFLTHGSYQHRYFADLRPTVSDIFVDGAWKTILIGGQRGGGRGLYALDITDPADFTEAKASEVVEWELTSADDPDLGFTFSQPTVAMLNNGRWAAIFGNGYNDQGEGEAKLFVVYLDADPSDGWTEGRNAEYFKISTEAGDTSNRNGLATPAAIDLDGDRVADRVYAGDLRGNVWAFDLSDDSASNWQIAHSQGNTPAPLFEGSGDRPVTTLPVAIRNTDVPTSNNNEPNTLVLFGTGQYLTKSDLTTTDTQSFYGVWDDGDGQKTRSDLVEQELGLESDLRVIASESPVEYTGSGNDQDFGWRIDMPVQGERIVTRPAVRGDNVFFNTTIPSSDACEFGGGGWLMSVNALTGGEPESPVFDITDDDDVTDVDVIAEDDGTETAPVGERFTEGLPAASVFLSTKQYTPGTKTKSGEGIDVREVEKLSSGQTGRLSWQDLSR